MHCFCTDCIRCGCGQWEKHHVSQEQVMTLQRRLDNEKVNLKKRYQLLDVIRRRCTWEEYVDSRDDLSPGHRFELKRRSGLEA